MAEVTEMTPLERAARAVQNEFARQNTGELVGAGGDIDDPEAMARAVLQAIREPSEGMVEAGTESSGIDGYVNDFHPIVPYQAMIDAALEEG